MPLLLLCLSAIQLITVYLSLSIVLFFDIMDENNNHDTLREVLRACRQGYICEE